MIVHVEVYEYGPPTMCSSCPLEAHMEEDVARSIYGEPTSIAKDGTWQYY
jgi:hypothetical protein